MARIEELTESGSEKPTLEGAMKEIARLQNEVAVLRRENYFLRNIANPPRGAPGAPSAVKPRTDAVTTSTVSDACGKCGFHLPVVPLFEPIMRDDLLGLAASLLLNRDDVNKLNEEEALDGFFRGRRTPLQWAAHLNRPEAACMLIRAGAEIDLHQDVFQAKESALHLACRLNHAEVVRVLLDHGADVNEVCKRDTPLTRAAYFDADEVIPLLLERGADMTRKGSTGETPLEVAQARHHWCTAKVLKEHMKSAENSGMSRPPPAERAHEQERMPRVTEEEEDDMPALG